MKYTNNQIIAKKLSTLTKSPINIAKDIEACLNKLCSVIVELGIDRQKIHLIAISRKMPRIFEWIENECEISNDSNFQKCKEHLQIIKECGVVSEHAIPFILASDFDKEHEIIVIDDIIISGQSMKGVVDDIYAYTQKKPRLFTIYHTTAMGDNFPDHGNFIYRGTCLSEEEKTGVIQEICNNIASFSLPMELEFPIFHFNENYDILKQSLHKRAIEIKYRTYEKPKSTTDNSESISVILEHELKRTLNHDFAKLRLFKKKRYDSDNSACLQVNAPRVLTESECQLDNLFSNKDYSTIWKKILHSIYRMEKNDTDPVSAQRMLNRRFLSLVVWANYLFSFSVGMNTCINTILLEDFPNVPQIISQDIELILGKKLAQEVTGDLNKLALERIVEMSTVEELQITEMWFAPKQAKEYYEIERYRTTQKNDLREAIRSLFSTHLQIGGFGETIGSLRKLYHSLFFNGIAMELVKDKDNEKEKDFEKDLNEAIDNAIDNGIASPFYQLVKNSSGIPCYRRFYKGGSNSICF